jgi:2-hydroxy-6-oxonona-2,4-dienedioate hydrolase
MQRNVLGRSGREFLPAARRRHLQSLWLPVLGRPMLARVAQGLAHRGPPIVLVHGLGVSSRYMTPLAQALAPFRNIYAPDLPGFGQSAKPARALGIGELAEALAAWMVAADLPPAVLIGNSMGCQIIIDLAARRSARVAKLVLISPTMDAQARTALRQCWRLARAARREPLSEWIIALGDYLRFGLPRAWQTLQDALADPVEAKLPAVGAPTLVVRGERDPIVSPSWAEEVTRLLPNGRLVVMPGGPHAMNYSRPDELARLIVTFLTTT